MKIVIIEDELVTAKDLAKTIKNIEPDAEILPYLSSVEEAVEFLSQKPEIDLIFSDIELGDGLCFDIFQQIDNQVPIIFCTAYEQYTFEAFKTAGIDYILKPFNKASIEKTLNKFKSLENRFSKRSGEFGDILTALKSSLYQSTPSVIVHQGEKIIPVSGNDIAIFFYEDLNTFAYTFNQKKYLVSQKMETLEKIFFTDFFRANRQHLVNRKAIRDAEQYFHRKMVINLTIPFSEQIIVGKLKTTEFVHWLAAR